MLRLQAFIPFFLLSFFLGACSTTRPKTPQYVRVSALGQSFQDKQLVVANIQYPIEGNKTLDEFLKKVEAYIAGAKKNQAELVIFPELFSLDTLPMKSDKSEAENVHIISSVVTPKLFAKTQEWSRQYNISLLMGSSPRIVEGKTYNTALFVSPSGHQIMQDKMFLTPWEKKSGCAVGKEIEVFDTPWGRTAILICYDSEFPLISQALAPAMPALLLVPSQTESPSGLERVRWSAQARAVEHHAFVVVSASVGKPSNDWILYGQGAVISPRDKLFSEKVVEGELGKASAVYSLLDIEKLFESRKTTKYYPAMDQLRQ